MDNLKNTNQLFSNYDYQFYLSKIDSHEKNRDFCRHNMTHFLSVARITTIKCLEKQMNLSKDLIYTTALLHDIGRFIQYEDSTPHEIASHKLAYTFLETLDFSSKENSIILDAIINHRNPKSLGFNRIFYLSDKLSRECFSCPVEKECSWSHNKKNNKILY